MADAKTGKLSARGGTINGVGEGLWGRVETVLADCTLIVDGAEAGGGGNGSVCDRGAKEEVEREFVREELSRSWGESGS